MTLFDAFIIGIMGFSVLFAWLRGFSREMLTLVAIGVGAAAVYFFQEPVRGAMGDSLLMPLIGLAFLFLIPFGLAWLGLEIGISNVLGATAKASDRWAGAAFGLLRGWVIVGLAYIALTIFAPEDNMPDAIADARLGFVAESAANILDALGLEKGVKVDGDADTPVMDDEAIALQ